MWTSQDSPLGQTLLQQHSPFSFSSSVSIRPSGCFLLCLSRPNTCLLLFKICPAVWSQRERNRTKDNKWWDKNRGCCGEEGSVSLSSLGPLENKQCWDVTSDYVTSRHLTKNRIPCHVSSLRSCDFLSYLQMFNLFHFGREHGFSRFVRFGREPML